MAACEVVKRVKKKSDLLFFFQKDDFLYWRTAQNGEIVILPSSIFIEFLQISSANGLDRETRVANALLRQEYFRIETARPAILAEMDAATPVLETNLPPRVSAPSHREYAFANEAIWESLRRIHRHRCIRSRARATF